MINTDNKDQVIDRHASPLINPLTQAISSPRVAGAKKIEESIRPQLQKSTIFSSPPSRPAPPPPSSKRKEKMSLNLTEKNADQYIHAQRIQSNLGSASVSSTTEVSSSKVVSQIIKNENIAKTNQAVSTLLPTIKEKRRDFSEESIEEGSESENEEKAVEKRGRADAIQLKPEDFQEEDFKMDTDENNAYQMQLIYQLAEGSNLRLSLDKTMNFRMEVFQDSISKQDAEVFSQLVEMIRNQAKLTKSPTCALSDGSKVTYSELLHRLSSCSWGKQVIQQHLPLKQKLETLSQKLIWIEFGIYEGMRVWLDKKLKKWEKRGKDIEKTSVNPPCKIFYRAHSKDIYIMPLNVTKESLHFLGKGQFKSATRLLNYKTGEIFACCDMVKITDPDRVGIKEGIKPKSIKEVECLQKFKQATGVLNLIDSLEYKEKGEAGKTTTKLLMITPLCEGGLLGSEGIIQPHYLHLEREEKLDIMRSLLAGLKNIHEAEMVHHDIDMSNILMKKDPHTNKWQAFIFDFGQAELATEGGRAAEKTFAKTALVDVLEMGKVFYRLFIDPYTTNDFKGKDWTPAAYQKMYSELTDPDLGIKQVIMQMLSPLEMKIRPNSQRLYQLAEAGYFQ